MGIAANGVPQRLLTDNGLALNPSRRGFIGQLVPHVSAMGVEPITGKPYRPTAQGKNERFHQTLFRFLDKQLLADTLAELQQRVDAFDLIHNTERPHQALPDRITPRQARDPIPRNEPRRPRTESERPAVQLMGTLIAPPHRNSTTPSMPSGSGTTAPSTPAARSSKPAASWPARSLT